jgi:geranylgeranylglycerol-phosphate geranylgeranyltransferase
MNHHYPLHSASFWRAYWITLRPYLFFVSGVSGLVGLSIPGGMSWAAFAPAFAAFFFSYGLGQALTDVFQTDTDSISSPYRPLTRGVIKPGQVLGVSLTGLAACALIFFLSNPWTLAFSVLGVLGLATYTTLKRRWWAGPFWNAWIVALLVAIGHLCGEPSPAAVFKKPVLWAAMISVFFSYAIFVLLGYFKDISADRATGYNTLPVKAGWRVSVLVSAAFALAATGASTAVMLLSGVTQRAAGLAEILAAVLWISGITVTAYAHILMLRIREESRAHTAIGHVVRGYLLLHLGEAMALKPALAAPAVIFYLLFEFVLATRPERTQI